MAHPEAEQPQQGPEREKSLRWRIYHDLREKLRRREISANERLVDVDIAKAAGVSRMPVREALLQLTIEGHLVSTTRGFALPALTDDDITDIFEVRKLLEPRAAANASRDLYANPDMCETHLGWLRDSVALAREAVADGSAEALSEANIHFRETWIATLRNRRLAATILRFSDQANVVRRDTLSNPETQQIVLQGLEDLLSAFERRDAMAAHDHMAAFMNEAERSFFGTQRGAAGKSSGISAEQDPQPGNLRHDNDS